MGAQFATAELLQRIIDLKSEKERLFLELSELTK